VARGQSHQAVSRLILRRPAVWSETAPVRFRASPIYAPETKRPRNSGAFSLWAVPFGAPI